MTKTIAIMGRGGTGKTSFTALAAKYLIEKKETPFLLVDADPDQNLAEMVGIDQDLAGKKSIAELLGDTFIARGGTTIGIPPSDRIENRIWEDGICEGKDFDLATLGTKWVEGCYCLPDAALKKALASITRQYRYIIIDAPGGLEHLNRKIVSDVDVILDVMGPSSKSFAHVRRARRVMEETGITYRKFYAVGGYAFPADLAGQAAKETGIGYLGTVSRDEIVADRVLHGESLLDVPGDSPAYRSVAWLLDRALE
jgi:CO dehydrogenase maturation factor